MDQGTLVEPQIDDGRRLVERFAADGQPIRAAFWLETAEEGDWFLYVVTDLCERFGSLAAYRAILDSLRKIGENSIISSEIKAIGPNNAVAKAVLEIMQRYPKRAVMRFGGRAIGSVVVEQIYIYPSRTFTFAQGQGMTTDDIAREILRLMNRGPGIHKPSRITLRDGTAFDGVPFSFQLGSQQAMVVQFIADGETAPRVIRLDEIASVA